jgi:hypothetical protein
LQAFIFIIKLNIKNNLQNNKVIKLIGVCDLDYRVTEVNPIGYSLNILKNYHLKVFLKVVMFLLIFQVIFLTN